VTIVRELRVAPEVAAALPASHLAQLQQDVTADDNVCVACGRLIEDAAAELVVLHDDHTTQPRWARRASVVSGVYRWEGTSAAVAQLTLRPDGLDVATALVWRRARAPGPRAIVLIEPRIHVSLDAADTDPLQRLFADPLGLHPIAGDLAGLAPPPPAGRGATVRSAPHGLIVSTDALRISVPSDDATLTRWRAHVDARRALVIVGRGLGITGSLADLEATLAEALALRPCWGATVTVG
jgi:hypothetical protein